jgi:hypothetical protein
MTLPRSAAAAGVALAGVALLATTTSVTAQPPAPARFCEVYPDAPACAAGPADCATCHTSPPTLNVYGDDIADALLPGAERPLHEDEFLAGLADALAQVEGLDSDGDLVANLEEIQAGTSPADAGSTPKPTACTDELDDGWDLCGYDPGYAYKKVMLDFCGRSPTLHEREQFADEKSPQTALHAALDACLDSEHWRGRGGRVWSLANAKIAPQQAVKSGVNPGPIPLADYDDDYAYFTWTQTGGRDARLVLTGQTFVTARMQGGVTVYEEWDRTPAEDAALRGEDVAQMVEAPYRAGMLTHRWFLMSFTMFTGVPRTTAAQAYRAYLGHDIARLEGLEPVPDEPVDYDTKGVAAPDCAVCHSTLDPLTYPFSRYEGIGGGRARSYSYGPQRMEGFADVDGLEVVNTPEHGVLFGQTVSDLVEWAEVAANSRDFREATVGDYWALLLGEGPRATELGEYADLVDAFGGAHGYSVDAMLHDLIDTEAYGAP